MRYALFLLLLSWHSGSFAQLNGKYTFRHIDQTDGLLHTTIQGISQDKRGFIWILTLNGLQRYDGSRFLNYPEITNQYSFERIHDSELFMDTLSNVIWIFKGKEMQRLDLATNSFTTVSLKSYIEDNSHFPTEGFKDADHEDWKISEAGVIRNIGPNTYYVYNYNPGQSFRENYILKDPVTGNFWLHGFDHFIIVKHGSGQYLSSTDPQPEDPLLRQLKERFGTKIKFRYLLLDSYHNLWISTWEDELLRYNLDLHTLNLYSLKEIKSREEKTDRANLNVLVNAMYEDRQKNLWFGTDYAGLLRYDRAKDDFEFITSEEKIRNGLQYNFSIWSIFQDRDDNIWLGTDRGINVFNPYHPYFQTIRHIEGEEASLSRHDINDVIETSQGEILVATWGGGVTFYDQAWNFIRHQKFIGPEAYNLTWCLVEKEDGLIWVGAQLGFLHQYDPVLHTFKTFRPPETENSTISTMVRDHDGNILIALFNGKIVMWNKAEDRFYKPDMLQSLKVSSIHNLFVDHANTTWGASATGLVEYHSDLRKMINVYLPDSTDSSIGVSIEGIEQYNDSMLLIGTIYRGLYLFNVNSKKFSRLPGFDMPVNSSVFAIKKDQDGFWFTTNFNLYHWRTETNQMTIFNLEPSMVKASFSSGRFYPLSDGRWTTNTEAEVVCFDPQAMAKDKSDLFDVEISRMNILGNPIFIDSFLHNHEAVVLPFDLNFFSIEFTDLGFTGLRQTIFFYRLIGIDKNWMQTTTQPLADYTDLKPGHYSFEVKASDGMKTTPVTSFPIILRPPWWGTWWFRSLFIVVLGLLGYVVIRKRIQSIRHEADLKHQIAQTEMMALRSQMNPHFIFNCINSIDGMIQSNDKYRATMYLNKFAKLIRNVLDISKENKVPLYKDMETLQLYIDLELFRYQDKFTSHIQADEELMQQDYKVPPLIIQPYVENAIHHGLRNRPDHEGRLEIKVSKVNEQIIYTIEDNGTGRKTNPDQEKRENGNGYGMQMSSDRIRLFNNEEIASVNVTDFEEQGKPSGTRVEVRLKIQ